jgi:hypothetical protein
LSTAIYSKLLDRKCNWRAIEFNSLIKLIRRRALRKDNRRANPREMPRDAS